MNLSAYSVLFKPPQLTITASLAPPWSGPLKVPIPVTIPEYISAYVEMVTLKAKVEAAKSCSA